MIDFKFAENIVQNDWQGSFGDTVKMVSASLSVLQKCRFSYRK